MDWRITSSSLVALIIIFAIIWSRVQINWESEYLSLYNSVIYEPPLIDNIFDVYLDKETSSLIYVKEECSYEDAIPGFFLHLVPANSLDLPASRQEFRFDNLDFHFEEYGFRLGDLGNICIIKVDLPRYDIVSLRTGQYVGESHQITNLWGEEVAVGQEQTR